MIFDSGLESAIEAVYLEESLCSKVAKSNIFVNPTGRIDYLVGKIIILNSLNVKEEDVKVLLRNSNKVISRIKLPWEGISFQPYILRINFGLTWNGEWSDGDLECTMREGQGVCSLTLPKIKNPKDVIDSEGNLTAIGWALHQIGQTIDKEARFQDLDVLKTKKMRLG